ncbi:siderophore ABC transporter substrate-binding protein [Sulfitobacter donghicola]|uniref:Iron ABC transporter substrate-binding protein n=1 Tax=Sulfitobacter donghicola DSW-25 = KCTC 12864 = JCM 14565 TaxID=1300350 RepID=A0A073IG32_9RHOB|nr:siderophore ABC transporter substrate-binding protein [Sulfitobacter donghicola]KEJ88495.1 iron ABC transporter substrate-binding protein [Sulfitobacter donghicola DSW-25 = KCTC 12864 = JCM 14565]KIN69629.1 ABC Fe+3 siderophore transporter, periplasmic substrate-binding protein [Sulfitobacter donghicola DSW-25 = KCTC 12864 = JCM 14565]
MLRTLSIILALATTPTWAQEVSIQTYSGIKNAPENPENVAVFDFSAFDSLTALGVEVQGLVAPVPLPYLQEAAKGTAPVGSLFEPDFEAVFAMQPDLIIAGGRSSKQVPELAKIAPAIDMTVWADTVGEGLLRLAAYGQIFDREEQAQALTAAFNAKVDEAKTLAADQGGALILMTNGPKVSAYGAGGRFGWLHNRLGLKEAVPNLEKTTHGEAISFEFIRDAQPQILIVIDRLAAIGQEGASAQTTLDNPLVHDTPAWQSGRVIYLSSGPIYIAGGGIQSMNLIVDEILAGLKDK